MVTYTVDLFTTLDGFGSGTVAYWGKQGPELLAQRARTFGETDQALVFGANTYRLFQRFAPAEDEQALRTGWQPYAPAPRAARSHVRSM